MNLGIFLTIGSSFKDQEKSGQDKRFLNYYLKPYAKGFKKVFIFSYAKETYKLPKNCRLFENKKSIHRFLYTFLMPLFYYQQIKKIDVFRVMQLSGAVPALITKIFFKKPFLVTYGYDYKAFARLQGKSGFLFSFLEKIAVKLADGFIVTNKAIEKYLKNRYPNLKTYYIPNGVDIKLFKPNKKSSLDKMLIKVLFVGRLENQKNLESLIKATSLLKNKFEILLTFIGQGSLKKSLMLLAKKTKVNLRIINPMPHGKLPSFYQQGDIFILPSFLEGNPKVLLEAMACGLPCITGRYKGVEEFIEKKAVLETGFNANSIAKNLKLLITDLGLRKSLSKAGRNLVIKTFDINVLLKREIELLKNISSQKSI